MRRILSLAALSILALSATANAQRSSAATSALSPELGIDAALAFDLSGTPKTTRFDFPAQRARVGFFLSPEMSLEPSLGLHTLSVSNGGGSVTVYDLGLGLLYHFSPSRATNQLYVRPFVDFSGASTSGPGSVSAFTIGGGFGVKMPVANRFATRLEGYLSHTGDHNGIPASNSLGILFGLSVYTH
jgi:hypothetical protein